MTRRAPPDLLSKAGYKIEVEDDFDGPELDRGLWFPYYLPHWSSRSASAARYSIADGMLTLRIDADQPPWCPEWDGGLRVSSLQTGVFAGPLGSPVGQHRFREGLVVREEQPRRALHAPTYRLVEARVRAHIDPNAMVALWMIGFEDAPEKSAEICVFEIFGRDINADGAAIGMGVHPFGDPTIVDEFATEQLPIDVRDFHTYAAEWTPRYVAFYVDDRLAKVVHQSPAYPMQFMLSLYDFPTQPATASSSGRHAPEFVVDWFRTYRPRAYANGPSGTGRTPRSRASAGIPRRGED